MRQSFEQQYLPHTLYRQTGVVLAGLVAEAGVQFTLFDDTTKIAKMAKIYECVDELSRKYGKHAIQHAASLPTKLQAQHEGERGDVPQRKGNLFNSLAMTKVTDGGLKHLQGLKRLKTLDLWGTDVTDAGMQHIEGMKQLEGLTLGYTKITDAGLKRLKC